MNRVTPIAEIIEQMDAGLDRAVLRVLEKRVGEKMAIQKPDLLFELNRMGFGSRLSHDTFERQVRRCIVELRNQGQLICSSSGGGGYFLAETMAEFDVFIEQEYRGRIRELQGTVDAMTKAAIDRWGNGVQMRLF
jgi:hypothetical protein